MTYTKEEVVQKRTWTKFLFHPSFKKLHSSRMSETKFSSCSICLRMKKFFCTQIFLMCLVHREKLTRLQK